MLYLPIFFRVASLPLWQSYDCQVTEVQMKDTGKPNTTKPHRIERIGRHVICTIYEAMSTMVVQEIAVELLSLI